MKKLFLLVTLTMTALTALPNEIFSVADEQGYEYLYCELNTPGEVAFINNPGWESSSSCPESVILPATVTYEGIEYKVTEIGIRAFSFAKISSVTLPDGLKVIADEAFRNSSITELVVPETVDSIGGGNFGLGPFSECRKLEKIQLPKGLRSISRYLFYNCRSLAEIIIPDGVTTIGQSAFYNCTSLAEITIPEGVTTIGQGAFYACSALKSIVIPDAVTCIGQTAFAECSSLETVKLPAGLDEFGTLDYWTYQIGIFERCNSLNHVTIPAGVKAIPYRCFKGCTSLSDISFAGDIQEIGNAAFYECSALDLEIPSSVKKIGGQAFWITAMKNVNLPVSLEKIANDAFDNTLENLYISPANTNFTTVDGVLYNKEVTELIIYPGGHGDSYTIPATVTAIDVSTLSSIPHLSVEPGSNSFSCVDGVLYDKDLTTLLIYTTDASRSLVVPASVKKIGAYAFSNKPIERVVLNEGLEVIDEFAFYCSSLSDINFPSTIVEIGDDAFFICGNLALTELNLPSTIEKIGYSAFCNIKSLTKVCIGDTEITDAAHTIIGPYAFSSCDNIQTVILGPCVKEVGNGAFIGSNPDLIVLSEGLETIGSNAFGKYDDEYRYPTEEFTLPSTLTFIGSQAFMNIRFPMVTCYAVTPPELDYYKPIYGGTLVVYDVAEQDYKLSDWASLFNSIETMEASGIEDIDTNITTNATTDTYYDLTGRQVTNPTTGIYIKNGKKVYIKR